MIIFATNCEPDDVFCIEGIWLRWGDMSEVQRQKKARRAIAVGRREDLACVSPVEPRAKYDKLAHLPACHRCGHLHPHNYDGLCTPCAAGAPVKPRDENQ